MNDGTTGRLAWSSRASRWKRRGRLRVTMVARVHLTPIFPTRGSVALSAHRRPHSLSRSRSRSRPRPRSRLRHFFHPSPLFSILEDPKVLSLRRESAWSIAPPETPTVLSFATRPFNAPLRPWFRNASALTPVPTHAPHSSLPSRLYYILLVIRLSDLSFLSSLSNNLASYTFNPFLSLPFFPNISLIISSFHVSSIAISFDESHTLTIGSTPAWKFTKGTVFTGISMIVVC